VMGRRYARSTSWVASGGAGAATFIICERMFGVKP
jgi:hypothetical protein